MKVLRILGLAISTLAITVTVDQYFFCPVYTFEKTPSFSGNSIYNPYASAIPGNWIKCNFHTHAHCWNGFTNGKGTANDVFAAYDQLKYNVHAISNYQSIDTTHQCSLDYLRCYEHGYNILKCHQLVLGASTVYWKDYLLPQTLSNKQYILDKLNNGTPDGLVVLSHPLLRNGYRASDFKYLTHYSCMEVLNSSCNSASLWDQCLSAGKPVFIIGGDDCHNVFDTTAIGRICTWINVPHPGRAHILQALKTGSSYAMQLGNHLMDEVRKGLNDSMPLLQNLVVKNDTLYTKFTLPAKVITISGRGGRILRKVCDTDTVLFKLDVNEPYARITAEYKDETKILLNPVFRYDKVPLRQASAGVDPIQTLWSRAIGAVVLILWFGFVFRLLFSKSTQQTSLRDILPGYEYVS